MPTNLMGMGPAKVAEKYGVSYRQARVMCYGEEHVRVETARDNARGHKRKLAWQREKDRSAEGRGTCESCGGPLGVGGARDGTQTCAGCCRARRDARARLIVVLWAEGLPMNELAERIGWTTTCLGKEMHWMRRSGYDLPYRYAAVAERHAA